SHGKHFSGSLGEILRRGAMGPTRSGKNVRVERQRTPAPDDESRANGAGHGRSGELSANSIQARKDICGGALVGKHARPRAGARASGKDRKSTRLNSSHVAISYAVFCLKKKKICGM